MIVASTRSLYPFLGVSFAFYKRMSIRMHSNHAHKKNKDLVKPHLYNYHQLSYALWI